VTITSVAAQLFGAGGGQALGIGAMHRVGQLVRRAIVRSAALARAPRVFLDASAYLPPRRSS